jgi:fucose permease
MKNPRLITFSCYAAFISLGMCGTLLGPTFQSLTQRFEIPLEQAGIFTGFQFGASTLGVVIVGRLLDRLNARYLLAGGVLFMGVGLLVLSNAPTLPVALFGALVLGLGFSSIDVSPNVVVASLNPGRASVALNALNVFFGIGAIIGPQLVNWALNQQNFTLAYTATAIFTLLLIIPFSMVSIHVHTGDRTAPRAAIRWAKLVPFAVLLFMGVGTEVGFGSWIVAQVTQVTLATAAIGTLAASLFWVGLSVGRIIASLILRWLTDHQLLIISILLIGVGVALLLLAPGAEAIAILSAFVVGFGCGPVFPTALAMINNRYPESRGTASGTLMAIGTMGAVFLPWLQGQIGGGQNGGMSVILVTAILMLGIVVLMQRQASLALRPIGEGDSSVARGR